MLILLCNSEGISQLIRQFIILSYSKMQIIHTIKSKTSNGEIFLFKFDTVNFVALSPKIF